MTLYAFSESTGRFVIPGAESLPGTVTSFQWDTMNVPADWYAFSAQVTDGDLIGTGVSPDWVHVVLPPASRPQFQFLTPTLTSTVVQGDVFDIRWDFFTADSSPGVVNLWAFSFQTGWFQIGFDLHAGSEVFPFVTGAGTPPGFYAFGVWVGVKNSWTYFASDNWLQVLPAV